MKKIIKLLVLVIAFFSLNAAMAQQELAMQASKSKGVRPPKLTIEQKATKAADSLKVKLNLTDIQYGKVIPVNAEFFINRDALRMKQKTDTTAYLTYKADLKVLHATRRTQLNAILTPDQKKIWSALRKNNNGDKTTSEHGNKARKDDDIDANEE